MTRKELTDLIGEKYDRMMMERGEVNGAYIILFQNAQDGEGETSAAMNSQVNTSPVAVLASVFRHVLSTNGKRECLQMLAAVMADCFPDFKMLEGLLGKAGGGLSIETLNHGIMTDGPSAKSEDEEFIPPQRPPKN